MTVEKSVEKTPSSEPSDKNVKPNMDEVIESFKYMKLKPDLINGIRSAFLEKPSPIQQRVIVSCCTGNDVIVQADVGSEKIAALSVSVLQRVDEKLSHVQVLVVTPTRVLAEEIQREINSVGKHLNVRAHACIGGTSVSEGILELEKGDAQVVVGTPGRLADMIKQNALHTDKVGTFVVVEADALFTRGFKCDVFNIFDRMPKDVQVVLFSAFMPPNCHLLNLNFTGNEDLLLASDSIKKEILSKHATKKAAGDASPTDSPKEGKVENKIENGTHKEAEKENHSEAPNKDIKKEASTRRPVVAVLSDPTVFCTPKTHLKDVKVASDHVAKRSVFKPKKRIVTRRTVAHPHFRLHYFDLRFRGETPRLIFAFKKIKYEDVRISKEEWATKKATYEHGQLPVLEIDGKPLSESFAINRYLGRVYGLAGKTPLESAFLDQAAEQFRSFYEALQPYVHAKLEYVPGDVAKLRETAYLPAIEKYLPWIESALKSSSSGFFGPSGLSWVDFYVTTFLEGLIAIEEDALAKAPELQALLKKVNSIPELQEYYAKRTPAPL